MRKFLFVLPIFMFFLFPSLSLADYDSATKSYDSIYDSYRLVYQSYTQAKNSFLKYKTLNSQSEALDKTKIFLKSRDDTLMAYYTVLREKLTIAEGMMSYDKILKQNLLDFRIAQFAKHKESIDALASLEDAVTKNKEIESLKDILLNETSQIIGLILIGKVQNEGNSLGNTIQDLTSVINSMKQKNVNMEKLERWLLDTNYKFELGNNKILRSRTMFDQLPVSDFNQTQKDVLSARTVLAEGNQYFKETGYNAQEAIKEIKTGPYK